MLCVSGLPLGATSTIAAPHRACQGEDGLGSSTLKRRASSVAMGNRRPRLIVDSRLFLLPRGQAPRIGLASVNVSDGQAQGCSASAERNDGALDPRRRSWARRSRAGRSTAWTDNGKLVWEGSAEIAQLGAAQPASSGPPSRCRRCSTRPAPMFFRVTAERRNDGGQGDSATPGRHPDRPGAHRLARVGRADGSGAQLRLTRRPGRGRGAQPVGPQQRHPRPRRRPMRTGSPGSPPRCCAGPGPQAAQAIHGAAWGRISWRSTSPPPSFDLSDRGVEGAAHPGPLDAFVWTDRGIYRPGETVQLHGAAARRGRRAPADLPATVTIKRPNGQTFLTTDAAAWAGGVDPPAGGALGSRHPPASGSAELRADPARPPIGRAEFRVDAFVPDRMAVEVDSRRADRARAQPYALPVTARFLYGAPAANLTRHGVG